MFKLLPLALLPLAIPAVAGADVKAGVDAWGRGDYSRAVQEWRAPAIAGDADAQFNLAQAYKLGRGVPVDTAQAESWFRKAADKGHQKAQDNYGLALFQSGRKAEAAPWLSRSADRGEPRAQLVLGTMLFNGDGVPRDYMRAYALMTRASQAGLTSAGATLAQMDAYITPEDRERGLKLAEEQASAPPPPAPIAKTFAAQPAPRPGHLPTLPSPKRFAEPPIQATAPAKPRATGSWRVQLGAFRDRGNAEALWSKVRGRMAGAQPDYVTGGGMTRLHATGFASKAAAQAACKAAGTTCLVVAP